MLQYMSCIFNPIVFFIYNRSTSFCLLHAGTPFNPMSFWTGGQCFLTSPCLAVFVCAGSSVSGYDDTSSDNSTADAADPSAASPEPSAAPGSSPAATGPHVTAGNVQPTLKS